MCGPIKLKRDWVLAANHTSFAIGHRHKSFYISVLQHIITAGERRGDKAVIKLTENVVNVETAALPLIRSEGISRNAVVCNRFWDIMLELEVVPLRCGNDAHYISA